MEQSDHERPSRNPARAGGVKFGENVFGVVAAVFRNGKDAYNDGKHTGKSPKDGKSLLTISNITRGRFGGVSHQAMAAICFQELIPHCTRV